MLNIARRASSLVSRIVNTKMEYFKFKGYEELYGGLVKNIYEDGVSFKGIYIADGNNKLNKLRNEVDGYLAKYEAHIVTCDLNIKTLYNKDTSSNDYIRYNNYDWDITGITDHTYDNGWIRIYITRRDENAKN